MNTASLLPPQFEMDAPHDPLLLATMELERFAKVLDLEGWIVERLRHCEQETVVNLLLGADDGRAQSVTGICVQHSSVRGAMAVPFRVSGMAYRNSICAEAMRTSWLAALYGVPCGGGAAALIVDAEKLSERELHKAVKGFGAASFEVLGSAEMVVPHGVHGVEMDWLESGLRERDPGTRVKVTGKASTRDGSSRSREFAIGIAELVRAAAGNLKQKIAIQGFGEDLQALATYLHEKGGRIVSVADESGGIAHELGVNPGQLMEHVRRHGVLLGYPDGAAVLNEDVVEAECDVLVLGGGDRQLQENNASKVRARVVVEVSPGAVTEGAARSLAAAGKVLISNLLCSGPRLLSAEAEAQGMGPEGRRAAWIRRVVRETWRSVAEAAQRWRLTPAEAATAVGIQRVAATLRAQVNPF